MSLKEQWIEAQKEVIRKQFDKHKAENALDYAMAQERLIGNRYREQMRKEIESEIDSNGSK